MVLQIYIHGSFDPVAENNLSDVLKHVFLLLMLDELQTKPAVAQYLINICDLIVLFEPRRESWEENTHCHNCWICWILLDMLDMEVTRAAVAAATIWENTVLFLQPTGQPDNDHCSKRQSSVKMARSVRPIASEVTI